MTGLLEKSGVFDTSVGLDFLNGIFSSFDYQTHRKVAVSCVDVNKGNYVVFNETDPYPDLAKAVLSSASIPFVFPHQVWSDRGVVCMDGGTVWNTNLVSAIERCRE